MSMLTTLKRWLGLAPKPESEPAPIVETKTVDLPNGRRAMVDEAGNFLGFEKPTESSKDGVKG
jgi:hypothetical protein